MKTKLLCFAISVGLGLGSGSAYSQNVGQDVKDAGHDTKTATKKGYDKSTSGVKKGYKKSTHATKKGVNKAADKVADKTSTTE